MTKSFIKSDSSLFLNNICGGISFLTSGFLKRAQKVLAFITDFFRFYLEKVRLGWRLVCWGKNFPP